MRSTVAKVHSKGGPLKIVPNSAHYGLVWNVDTNMLRSLYVPIVESSRTLQFDLYNIVIRCILSCRAAVRGGRMRSDWLRATTGGCARACTIAYVYRTPTWL
ncbi:unnamed protein product [Leptosia nina]|uniref:Uncharacterized protein n=1 Tax=Leptosia nina TaxID=320188 RepID=A0AAV1J5K9_9NEOP